MILINTLVICPDVFKEDQIFWQIFINLRVPVSLKRNKQKRRENGVELKVFQSVSRSRSFSCFETFLSLSQFSLCVYNPSVEERIYKRSFASVGKTDEGFVNNTKLCWDWLRCKSQRNVRQAATGFWSDVCHEDQDSCCEEAWLSLR